MVDKVRYWAELSDYDLDTAQAMLETRRLSDYDLDTAQAMLETRRFLYVGFMCHQVIEKILKAYWSKVLEDPPLKIHHLSRLAAKSGIMTILQMQLSYKL